MAKIEAWLSCDLKKPVQVQGLSGNVFSMDNNGSRINVRIYDNGEKTTVSGSVTANCILADGSTINVNGSLTTDNGQSVAYVDIPQSCLLVPGPIRIAIKLTASGVITTLAAVVTTVYRTQTDIVITPSAQIITDWNAEISAAIATQNAAIANQDTKINDLKSALDVDKGVLDLQDDVPLPFKVVGTGGIEWETGDISTSVSSGYTDYVDLTGFSSIKYRRCSSTASSHWLGMAFYNADKSYNSGQVLKVGQQTGGYYGYQTIAVPENAVYARFTTVADTTTYGEFGVSGNSRIKEEYNNQSQTNQKMHGQIKNIGSILNGVSDITSFFSWEQGQFDTTVGRKAPDINTDYTKRIKSNPVAVLSVSTITVESDTGFSYFVCFLDSSGTVVYTSPERTGRYQYGVYNNGREFLRIICKKTDDSTIEPSDISGHITVTQSVSSIDEIKEDTNQIDAIKKNIPKTIDISSLWEQGRFTGGNPGQGVNDVDSDTRIRTPYIDITGLGKIIVECATGYSYAFYLFNSSKIVLSNSDGWTTVKNTYDVSTGKYIRLVLKHGEDNITPSAGTNCTVAEAYPLYEDISELKADRDGQISDIFYLNDPKKIKHLLDNASNTNHSDTSTAIKSRSNLVNLIHFSDVHLQTESIQRILEFNAKYSDYIFTIIHSGDCVNRYENTNPFASVGGSDILNVIGNHECFKTGDTRPIPYNATETEVYEKFFSPYISNWGVNSAGVNKCYYYKDYSNSNIRMIVLDSIHWNEDQQTWFVNLLASSKTAGKAVLIVTHYPAQPGVTKISCTFNSLGPQLGRVEPTQEMQQIERLPDDAFDKVDDFIHDGGHFISWLVGHTHEDYIGVVTNHTNQLQIVIGCALITNANSDCARTPGMKSQDLFNIVSIDTNTKLIKLIRIGATVDKFMRSRETLCIKYDTKQLISNT